MSDVRLSNGSPPLERVDARLADHTRPPVCRNLFGGGGAADAAELRRDCAEQLREMARAQRDKWNFDFARDEPLSPGQYEWEAVDGRSVPDFYSRPPRGAEPERTTERAPARSSPSPPNPSLENGAAVGGGDGGAENTAARPDRRETRKRPSTEQQDGASQSKRANSDAEEAEETNHCPDESPSVEQTPVKKHPNT
ncbi:cyclin-dependent kinase inhibitor 1Ba [Colossoma macropomum]|uniref:cyclin-dependent kinase inhibitor 1Ba n=1 Tax=Colossoma macropomum TaxID=42526 RepID=UPI0018651AE4|nr:cyclin-dependent kinase inhibitor 1Ba [Colossoma macropomum]